MADGPIRPWHVAPPPKGWRAPKGERSISRVLDMWDQAGFGMVLVAWMQPQGLSFHLRCYVSDAVFTGLEKRMPGTQEGVHQFIGGFTIFFGGILHLLDDFHWPTNARRN